MNLFFNFKNELLLGRTSRQFEFSGQVSACYNHENQADRQSCHSSSKSCSEFEWFIWNILPQLWLKLLLHTFQCIAMAMHRFFNTVCCIKFNKNVIGIISHSVFRIVEHLCLWLRNDLVTEGEERQRCLSPLCMPVNRYITAQITLLRKKIRPLYKSVCTNFVTSLSAG